MAGRPHTAGRSLDPAGEAGLSSQQPSANHLVDRFQPPCTLVDRIQPACTLVDQQDTM
eukprot:COSAG01_NODE_16605_length_1221_cov_8.632799_3_plen_57_part_01